MDGGRSMGVFQKQGTWWIDWYEGGRRRRKKTRARNKTEARKLLEQVRARIVPRELGLFDPKLKCAELITRYLEALKGTRAHHTWRRAYTALRNFFTWCPVKRVAKLTPGQRPLGWFSELPIFRTILRWAFDAFAASLYRWNRRHNRW